MEKQWFLVKNYIRVSPQSKITLNHIAHVISLLFHDSLYLQVNVAPLKITLGEIFLPKVNRRELE